MLGNILKRGAMVSLLLAATVCAQPATKAVCSGQDASAAEDVIGSVDSWDAVNAFHEKFAACDDGGIAEGLADDIARILVDKWDTLPSLQELIDTHKSLRAFVLYHINTVLDVRDVRKIKQLSAASCPAQSASLCSDLSRAADNTMQEWKSLLKKQPSN